MVLALVTGNLTRIGWHKLTRAGVHRISATGIRRDGPDAERTAKSRLHRRPRADRRNSRISLIGDATTDVQAALDAGIQSIAVRTGITSKTGAAGPHVSTILHVSIWPSSKLESCPGVLPRAQPVGRFFIWPWLFGVATLLELALTRIFGRFYYHFAFLAISIAVRRVWVAFCRMLSLPGRDLQTGRGQSHQRGSCAGRGVVRAHARRYRHLRARDRYISPPLCRSSVQALWFRAISGNNRTGGPGLLLRSVGAAAGCTALSRF